MERVIKISFLLMISLLTLSANLYGKKLPTFTERKEMTNLLKDSFVSVTNDLITKGSYPSDTSWRNGYCYKSSNGKVILGLKSFPSSCPANNFTLKVGVRLKYMNQMNHVDSLDTMLVIRYDKLNGKKFTEKSVYTTINTHYLTAKILSISDTSLRKFAYLEAQIEEDRIYCGFELSMVPQVVGVSYLSSSSEIEIVLDSVLINKVEGYEIEWTFIDGYTRNGLTDILPKNYLYYDFRQDASRVYITSNRYKISNVFEKGYVLVRARAVGYGSSNLSQTIRGNWSISSNGSLSSPPSLACIIIDNTGTITTHEQNLVWQYSVSYAEEGKKKESIAYFDGILKNRQNVTKNNADTISIVGETIYDYEGRPAIQVLPVPTNAYLLKYFHSFNKDTLGHAYSYRDFDLSSTCTSLTLKMDTSSGASRYYSQNNTWLNFTGQSLQKNLANFIPDAYGFPFTQTEFMPDNTGRVRRQSGVGPNHKIGSSHDTRHFYATPFQEELNRLFGSEVGYNTHYKKSVTIDANGQASVSYTDSKGRVIATGLAGGSTSNTSALSSNISRQNILAKLKTDADTLLINNSIVVSKKVVITDNNTAFGIDYSVEPEKYFPACNRGNACYDCVYDLEISVINDCGNEEFKSAGDTVRVLKRVIGHGLSNIDTSNNNSTYAYSFLTDSKLNKISNYVQLTLQPGSYHIIKKLSVNDQAYSYYLNDYLTNRACKTKNYFELESWRNIDTNTCEMTCESCNEMLGSKEDYLSTQIQNIVETENAPTHSDTLKINDEYDMFKSRCDNYCKTAGNKCDAILDILKSDVSPGGQFAEYTFNTTNNTYEPLIRRAGTIPGSNYPNIYNVYNIFSPDNIFSFQEKTYFKNDSVMIDGDKKAYSDLTADQFFTHWRDTFANIFVPYHREYCKYERCILDSVSINFDERFLSTETYSEANAKGYLSPLTGTPVPDPYFRSGAGGISKLYDFNIKLNNYQFSTPYTVTIWDIAIANLFCDNKNNVSDKYNCIVLFRDSIDSCKVFQDYFWKTFRSLYYAEKQLVSQGLSAACNATTPPDVSLSNVDDTTKYHISIPYDLYPAPDVRNTSSAYNSASTKIQTGCTSQCHSYRDMWRKELLGCNIDTGSMSRILDSMESVCRMGCDEYNPMGSSTIAYRLISNTSISNHSFNDVLKKTLTSGSIYVPGVCDDILISMPKPYGHDYFVYNSPNSDTCSCDSLLYNNPLGLTWPCKDTVTVSNNKCPCSNKNNLSTKTNNSINILQEQAPQYKCKSCIGCEKFREVYIEFYKLYKDVSDTTYHFQELFTLFFNNRLKFNLEFKDYVGFAAQCSDTIYNNKNHHIVLDVFRQSNWIFNTTSTFISAYNNYVPRNNFEQASDNLRVIVSSHPKTNYHSLGTNLTLKPSGEEKIDIYRYIKKDKIQRDDLVASENRDFIFKPVTSFRPVLTPMPEESSESSFTLDTCGCNRILSSIQEFKSDGGKNYPYINTASKYFAMKYNNNNELKSFDTLAKVCCKAVNGSSATISVEEPTCEIPSDWHVGQWNRTVGGSSRASFLANGVINNPVSEVLPPIIQCECLSLPDTCACKTILEQYEAYKIDSATSSFSNFNDYFNYNTGGNGVNSMEDVLSICAASYKLASEPIGSETDGTPIFSNTYPQPGLRSDIAHAELLQLIDASKTKYYVPSGLSCANCQEKSSIPIPIGCQDFISIFNSSIGKRLLDSAILYPVGDNVYEDSLLSILNDSFNRSPYYQIFGKLSDVLVYMTNRNCICNDNSSPSLPNNFYNYCKVKAKYVTCPPPSIGIINLGDSRSTGYFMISSCLQCYKPNATLFALQEYLDTLTLTTSLTRDSVKVNLLNTSWWKMYPKYGKYYNSPLLYNGGNAPTSLKYKVVEIIPQYKLVMEMFDSVIPKHSRKVTLRFPLGYNGNFLLIRSFFAIQAVANQTCDTNIHKFTIYASLQRPGNVGSSHYDTVQMDGEVSDWQLVKSANCCLKLCNKPIDEMVFEVKNPCKERMKQIAYLNANEAYGRYIDSLSFAFKRDYYAKCMRGANATEKFRVKYNERQYHYTLYYYNQAGNLVRTVPPAGVAFITDAGDMDSINARRIRNAQNIIKPSYNLSTEYSYNSLNAITWQKTPDAGESNMYYDNVGRLLVSQNAKQQPQHKYSYNKYDALARLIEVGQITQTSSISSSITFNPNSYINWLDTTKVEQITNTYYDNANYDILDTIYFKPQNLRSRVAYSTYREHSTTNYNHAVHYSYDIHGNVKSLLREIPALASIGQDYKIIEYDYDLVSGKVNNVYYQRNEIDAYQHQYSYDAENRITQVQSGPNENLIDKDAAYYYYLHGPLARTELGKHQVQGVDYAYTLQGWVKGVNASSNNKYRDMGKDGTSTNPYFVTDEFGYSLSYYTGDYRPIGTSNFEASTVNASLNDSAPDLFNGNIRMSSMAIKQFGNTPMAYAYKYDQLNRLTSMNAYQNFDSTNNKWSASGSALQAYHNRFTYDANGNILTQVRRGNQSKLGLDSLDYEYYSNTNKLKRVYDGISSGNYSDDIDNQTNTANYEYDEIGNLIKDKAEEIDKITWNVYGKITRIQRISSSTKPDLEFQYTPDGHRVVKVVITKGANKYKTYTYYVRDAQGNIMATYERKFDKLIDYDSILYANVNNEIISQVGLSSFASFIANKHQDNTAMKNNLENVITSNNNYSNFFVNSVDVASYMLNQENLIVANKFINSFKNYNFLFSLTWYSDYGSNDITINLAKSMNYRYTNNSNYNNIQTIIAKNDATLMELFSYLYTSNYQAYFHMMSHFGIQNNSLEGELRALINYKNSDIQHVAFIISELDNYLNFNNLEDYTSAHDIVDYLITNNEVFRDSLTENIPDFKELFYNFDNPNGGVNDYQTSLNTIIIGLTQNWEDYTLVDKMVEATGDKRKLIYNTKNQDPYQFVRIASGINFGAVLISNYQSANKCLYIANCASGNTHNGMKEYFNEIGNYFGNIQRYELEDEYMSVSKYYVDTFNLNEWHMYGSSRLGVYNTNLNLVNVYFHADTSNYDFTNVNVQSTYIASPNYNLFSLERGAKRYELSNWLGNVNVVITDKRVPVCNADTVTYYTADVVSANDYSPFGAPLAGRTWYSDTISQYRFGFNGKEDDNEVKGQGNSQDFGSRIYDNRLGRWLSVDPEASIYPAWSPYVFVRDNPILRVDPTGKWDIEVHVYKDREKYGYGTAIVKDRHGKEVFRFEIRAQGTAGANRMKEDANTPLGTYDIPDQGMWKDGGSRKSYGPNPRLILDPESGEIKESNRDDIRIHGGRQEEYDEATGKWIDIKNPQLKKTHGCLRALDEDVATLKSVTDKLMKNDSKENGGKLTIVDDLEKKDGKYVIPDNSTGVPLPPSNDIKSTNSNTKKTGGD